jgi:hypothetical protein
MSCLWWDSKCLRLFGCQAHSIVTVSTGAIRGCKFLGQMSNLLSSQEARRSMELLIYLVFMDF